MDGLIETGAGKATSYETPFLREPAKISLNVVFSKIPGWAFAWSLGWLVFWIVVFIFLFIGIVIQGKTGWEDLLNFLAILFSGMIGGFAGGLIAGLFTMLALRPNAPSISWKHMSPTIRIWSISGPLGLIVSGVITAIILAWSDRCTKCNSKLCWNWIGRIYKSSLAGRIQRSFRSYLAGLFPI